jgi:hypothetical protein
MGHKRQVNVVKRGQRECESCCPLIGCCEGDKNDLSTLR